jgi:hypothetical protein
MWSYKAPQRGSSHIGECWTIFHSSTTTPHCAGSVQLRVIGRSAYHAALYTLSYLRYHMSCVLVCAQMGRPPQMTLTPRQLGE